MTKPKALEWLDEQTGEDTEWPFPIRPADDGQYAILVPDDVAVKLMQVAAAREQTIAVTIRSLIEHAVPEPEPPATLDNDKLISQLSATVAEVKRRLAR